MSQPASIFLSHSHKDKPFVRRLATDLASQGIRVWVDEAEMFIGDSLITKIGEAIDSTDFVGAVLSSHSVDSSWVKRELDIALNHEIDGRRVKVLPLVIDNCTIPPFLIGKVYGDFRDVTRYDETVSLLMRRLMSAEDRSSARLQNGSAQAVEADGLIFEKAPFAVKLLVALNELRPLAATMDAEGNARRFLLALNDLGELIRGNPTELIVYRSAKPFQKAFNDFASISGQEVSLSMDEIREIFASLQYELDALSVEVGMQALRGEYDGDRERAARILGHFGPTAAGAVGPLRQALKDPSGPVRLAACWALSAIGTEEADRAVADYERS